MQNLNERLLSLCDSKVEIADVARVSKQSVTNWVTRDSISKKAAERLAKHFNINMEWLLTGQGEKSKAGKQAEENTNSLLDQLNKAMPSATPRTAKLIIECQRLANRKQGDLTEQELNLFLSVLAVIKEKHG